MSDQEKRGKFVNRADLADTFGISLPTVDAWVKKGCPVVERGSKGRQWVFDTAVVHDWRIQLALSDSVTATASAGGQISKDEADRRKAVAQAVVAEVDADEALKSVVSRFDAEALMADFCQALRAGMSNACTKIASRTATLSDPHEILDFCEAEINRSFRAAEADLTERWTGEKIDGDSESDDD